MNKHNVTFFASGSNHSGEIKALSLIPGANVGVVAEYVDAVKYPNARAELDAFVETERKVFIDSGAFGEIKFNAPERQGPNKGQLPRPELPVGCPFVIKPMTDKHWKKIFAVYADQALTHGPNVYVVAPDKVAFQAESLERLAKYAPQMNEIYDLEATILVPIQKGELSMAEFHARASAILGFEFRPSIPMKKDATTLEDLAGFMKAVMPATIHLLGMAPDTDEGAAAIAVVLSINPDCDVSCDACLIKRWVGKANGKVDKATGKKGPRRITQLNDLHVAKLALDLEACGEHEVHVRKALTLFLAASAYWTDLGLAQLPAYSGIVLPALSLPSAMARDGSRTTITGVKLPAGCDIEPAYIDLALAIWGVEAEPEFDAAELAQLEAQAAEHAYYGAFAA